MGLETEGQDSEFKSKCHEKSLEDFNQGSDFVIYILKGPCDCMKKRF